MVYHFERNAAFAVSITGCFDQYWDESGLGKDWKINELVDAIASHVKLA